MWSINVYSGYPWCSLTHAQRGWLRGEARAWLRPGESSLQQPPARLWLVEGSACRAVIGWGPREGLWRLRRLDVTSWGSSGSQSCATQRQVPATVSSSSPQTSAGMSPSSSGGSQISLSVIKVLLSCEQWWSSPSRKAQHMNQTQIRMSALLRHLQSRVSCVINMFWFSIIMKVIRLITICSKSTDSKSEDRRYNIWLIHLYLPYYFLYTYGESQGDERW